MNMKSTFIVIIRSLSLPQHETVKFFFPLICVNTPRVVPELEMPTAIGAHSTLRLYIAGAWLAGWAGLGGEERCWQGQGGWFLFFSSYGAGSPGLWERRTGTRASQRIWRSRGPHDGVTARGGKVDAQLSSPGGLISPVISPNRHPSFREWLPPPLNDLHISPFYYFSHLSCPKHTKLSIRFKPWNFWGLCSRIDVGPPVFTLLQHEMPTDGVWTDQCDQPLSLQLRPLT